MLPQLLVFILVGKMYTEAALSQSSFQEFEIGELFKKVDFKFSWTKKQFAIAKKVSSGDSHCQWAGLALTEVTPDNLPVEDKNKNCIFAPVDEANRRRYKYHSERIIDDFIAEKGYNRGDYDFYTYLAPCDTCGEGTPAKYVKPPASPLPPVKFADYAGCYYSEDGSAKTVPSTFNKISSNKLHLQLQGQNYEGLEALRLGS